MKINEVEAAVGVTKKNIRFYEEEGLISPSREPGNGYRSYSQADVERLRRIKLLRLTRNTDLCTPVHFDFNHEHIVVEEKKDNADRFQIKCYF